MSVLKFGRTKMSSRHEPKRCLYAVADWPSLAPAMAVCEIEGGPAGGGPFCEARMPPIAPPATARTAVPLRNSRRRRSFRRTNVLPCLAAEAATTNSRQVEYLSSGDLASAVWKTLSKALGSSEERRVGKECRSRWS